MLLVLAAPAAAQTTLVSNDKASNILGREPTGYRAFTERFAAEKG